MLLVSLLRLPNVASMALEMVIEESVNLAKCYFSLEVGAVSLSDSLPRADSVN